MAKRKDWVSETPKRLCLPFIPVRVESQRHVLELPTVKFRIETIIPAFGYRHLTRYASIGSLVFERL